MPGYYYNFLLLALSCIVTLCGEQTLLTREFSLCLYAAQPSNRKLLLAFSEMWL
jgi:hypothetical protein